MAQLREWGVRLVFDPDRYLCQPQSWPGQPRPVPLAAPQAELAELVWLLTATRSGCVSVRAGPSERPASGLGAVDRWPKRCSLRELGPQENALERIPVRPLVVQSLQQPLVVATQEPIEQLGRQASLVVGEQGAPDPLDDLLRAGQAVQVDLQADVLGGQAEPVEQDRVPLGGLHRPVPPVAPEGRGER